MDRIVLIWINILALILNVVLFVFNVIHNEAFWCGLNGFGVGVLCVNIVWLTGNGGLGF